MGADSYHGLFLINAAYFMKDENLVKYFTFQPSKAPKRAIKEEYES